MMNEQEFEKYRPLVESGAALDTLIALVENGPLWDGNVPSKGGRDMLVAAGLAVRIVANTKEGWDDGYQAATYLGRDVYTHYFGADRMHEGKANRLASIAIRNAKREIK